MNWKNFSFSDSLKIARKLNLEETNARSRDPVYWYSLDGKKTLRIVMPNRHGSSKKPISTGFIKQIRDNLKLSVEELEELVDCPLSPERYMEIIRERLGK